jgi:EsV-1-7 cysteine-rich motif
MESKKVKYKKCEKCDKKAYYNTPGSRSPRFCGIHREPDLVNVVCTKCISDGCMKQPCFNFEGKIPKFCADHREEGMVNLRERPCEKCPKKPVFNFPDVKKGRFCVDHKEEGMIDVLSQTCEHEGCRTRPSFGYRDGARRFCVRHKLENMVNLVSAMCIHEGCEKYASFNFKGEKDVLYCKNHKKEGMILVRVRYCAEPKCTTVPVFNFPGSKHGKFCLQHKEPGMVDVENPRCKTPMCGLHTPKDYCARCTAYMFPDQPSHFKTREMKLKEYLQATYPDKDLTHDKHVECHRYRPDFVFDMGSHTVVIELDENQHRTYDTSCDNKRLMSIFQGLGSRPMVMVRFNPDRYDDVPGCFKKDGQLTGNGQEWKKRTGQLKERIDFWFNTEPKRETTVEHLFFDTK